MGSFEILNFSCPHRSSLAVQPMRSYSFLSILLILMSAACVDRIFYDVGNGAGLGIVIDGYISDQPGPYMIQINSGHDLENKINRQAISVKELRISDNHGAQEVLSEVNTGVYQTRPTGIRGTVGRVYTLHLETFDGRVYESAPDTLMPPGSLDSLYYTFKDEKTFLGNHKYGFDILFNSTTPEGKFRFLWKFTGTFKCDAYPGANHNECFYLGDRCNFAPPCSGLRNIGGYTPQTAIWVQAEPCTCCTCWYNLFNDKPMLSDSRLLRFGRYAGLQAYYVPVTQWIFQNKIHIDMTQMSLSSQTFAFWKAIYDQKEATNSLFQPITGKIPSNFVQTSGKSAPVAGLFFAAGISHKSRYLTRGDVPNELYIPADGIPLGDDCRKFFGNSSNVKPDFWVD